MIDLIIPYYNNRIGLLNTINSINTDIFQITIVDDHSTEPPIINNSVAQIFRYNINSGPGYARQHGINHTHNDYIMFIDTGDEFISRKLQEEIPKIINENPATNIFQWSYFYNDKITTENDNRLHGKIYKRSFLNKYNITFCAESSYMNEDIGFNRTCRIISDSIGIPFMFIDDPILRWIHNPDSLTQKDNRVCLYKDQTHALALTSIHTIETCRKNNIKAYEEINQIAIALYYWFIRTAAERPKYLQDAWAGTKIFYDKFRNEMKLNDLSLGNGKCIKYRSKIKFPINILRFYQDITSEILPNKYLT